MSLPSLATHSTLDDNLKKIFLLYFSGLGNRRLKILLFKDINFSLWVLHILKQDFFRNLDHCEICILYIIMPIAIVTSENAHVIHQFCAPNVCAFYVYFIFVHEMSTLFMSLLFFCIKCLHFLCLIYFYAPNVYTFYVYFISMHQMSALFVSSLFLCTKCLPLMWVVIVGQKVGRRPTLQRVEYNVNIMS